MTQDVNDCVEIEKLLKPSAHSQEVQEQLLLDGIVHPLGLPSKSTISKCIREDLQKTRKRIQQISQETQKVEHIEFTNDFLDEISDLRPGTVHCFDKSSVIQTTCNRKHGNPPIGKPALGIQ